MKTLLAILLLTSSNIWAVDETNWFPILTFKGETHTNCHITSVRNDYAIVVWEGGGKKVSMADFPKEIQKRYGYDPIIAAQIAQEEAKKREAEFAADQAKYAKERIERAEAEKKAIEQAAKPLEAPGGINENTIRLINIVKMSYNEGITKDFPYTVEWTEYDLPKTKEAKSACKEIESELKQINKALEIGITYERFCQLFQEKVLAIEKIKDRTEGIPWQFISKVEDVESDYKYSRDDWKDEIDAYDVPEAKALMAIERRREWRIADVHNLYCIGMAEKNFAVNDLILRNFASGINIEQTIIIPYNVAEDKDHGRKSEIYPHPVVSKMTERQIEVRLRYMAVKSAASTNTP